jgi:hypothetical protein
MLGRLLSSAVNDFSSQDLHDRALLYYRLLSVRALSTYHHRHTTPMEESTHHPTQ